MPVHLKRIDLVLPQNGLTGTKELGSRVTGHVLFVPIHLYDNRVYWDLPRKPDLFVDLP
jgi:hypothetical protein